MTITDARSWVRQFARNAEGSDTATNTEIDRAIQFAGNDFVRRTRCTRTLSTVATTADDDDLSLSAVTGFRPDRLLKAWVDGEQEMDVVNLSDLIEDAETAETGTPTEMAFVSWTAAKLYPTPDDAYNIQLWWVAPFTTWTAGAADAPTLATALNIPDDLLTQLLTLLAPAALQQTDPQHLFAGPVWQHYLELVNSVRGAGVTAGRIASTDRIE